MLRFIVFFLFGVFQGIPVLASAQDYPARPVNIVIGYAPIVARLQALLGPILADDETRKTLANIGTEPFPGNAQFLAQMQARELDKWGRLLKLAKIEPE